MRPRQDPFFVAAMALAIATVAMAAAALLLGCSSGTAPPSGASTSPQGSANTGSSDDAGTAGGAADAGGSGTTASRPLLCTPSPAEVAACEGLPAGAGGSPPRRSR